MCVVCRGGVFKLTDTTGSALKTHPLDERLAEQLKANRGHAPHLKEQCQMHPKWFQPPDAHTYVLLKESHTFLGYKALTALQTRLACPVSSPEFTKLK